MDKYTENAHKFDFSKYSKSELCEIYNVLSHWGWDDRIGEKPENWDNIPRYYRSPIKELLFKNRYKILKPYIDSIKMVVGEKALLRHHWQVNLHRTEEEFNEFWENELYRIGQRID